MPRYIKGVDDMPHDEYEHCLNILVDFARDLVYSNISDLEPNHLRYRLQDGLFGVAGQCRRLEVTVESAGHLQKLDSGAYPDTFVVAHVQNKTVFTSKVCTKSLTPVWDEKFLLRSSSEIELNLELYNYNMSNEHDLLARGRVGPQDFGNILRECGFTMLNGSFTKSFPLTAVERASKGSKQSREEKQLLGSDGIPAFLTLRFRYHVKEIEDLNATQGLLY
uniref:C2 domain-containing protein n=2 Tax=Hanusia phi TaxID=3032 RepID=A0A7S0HBQ7_9CRYP|mmetsp:Transcript_18808/g.43229  ORF Transcript_18808/g.43229 Transcript_18808/m.43229 type:complete len:221 (+) Transcript_18808:57-719(+)